MMPAMPETTLQDAMALHRGGRVEEAITAYRAVIAAGHDLLPAGVNLGRLLTQLQRYEEAESVLADAAARQPVAPVRAAQVALYVATARYDQALQAAGGVPGAQGALLEAQIWLARDDVGKAFEAAGRVSGPAALADLGTALRGRGDFANALEAYTLALSRAPGHPELSAYAGVTLRDLGEIDQAIRILTQVLARKPDYSWAAYVLGECLLHQGRPAEAAVRFAGAAREIAAAWVPLVDAIFQAGGLPEQLPDVVLLACLQREDVDAQRLDLAIRRRLPEDDAELVTHPLFAPWLMRCVVQSVEWQERLHGLTNLPHEAAVALAVQDWHTEHAHGVRTAPSDPVLTRLTETEPAEEGRIAQTIPVLGLDEEDAVSLAVRAQYEAHPYPRLVQIHRREPVALQSWLDTRLPHLRAPEDPRKVLVAGAGTGQHPLTTATTFAGVEVLAIDLSRASLAKATRMAERLGVNNVRFAQADILALGPHPERFHLIESVGVLHHLADPLRGLQVLVGLLAEGGLMRLGLYSERARSSVVAARALLTDLPGTDEGIRKARARLIALPEDHPAREVTRSIDFFSLSGCRDLVMHAQEHRYTPQSLQALLDDAGLVFQGFQHAQPGARQRYAARFPDDPAQRTLANWDVLEREEPGLFAGMYVFWATRSCDQREPPVAEAVTDTAAGV